MLDKHLDEERDPTARNDLSSLFQGCDRGQAGRWAAESRCQRHAYCLAATIYRGMVTAIAVVDRAARGGQGGRS